MTESISLNCCKCGESLPSVDKTIIKCDSCSSYNQILPHGITKITEKPANYKEVKKEPETGVNDVVKAVVVTMAIKAFENYLKRR